MNRTVFIIPKYISNCTVSAITYMTVLEWVFHFLLKTQNISCFNLEIAEIITNFAIYSYD